jgi:predicted TIM-barrel enzyme
VNEAGLCGTPTLCSVNAGCCDDLIEDGVNGFTWDSTQAEAVSKLTSALSHKDLKSIGQIAKKHAQRFTLDGMAMGFRSAVEEVTYDAVEITGKSPVFSTRADA